jgi:hypothetical protein
MMGAFKAQTCERRGARSLHGAPGGPTPCAGAAKPALCARDEEGDGQRGGVGDGVSRLGRRRCTFPPPLVPRRR